VDFTEIEVVETPLWYGKCTYGERNDINTEHLFIVSLKTLKKERKKKIYMHLESITVTFQCGLVHYLLS